jgi:Transposase domain (DUF772)
MAACNLSDDQAEYQLRDRFSFMRFLGLELEDAVPDAKTRWTKKHDRSYFGYKNHIGVDRRHKFVRRRSFAKKLLPILVKCARADGGRAAIPNFSRGCGKIRRADCAADAYALNISKRRMRRKTTEARHRANIEALIDILRNRARSAHRDGPTRPICPGSSRRRGLRARPSACGAEQEPFKFYV